MEDLRRPKGSGLKRVDSGRAQSARQRAASGILIARYRTIWICQARAQRDARQCAEDKTARKERVRLRMVATEQFGTTKLHGVVAAGKCKVVRNLGAPRDCEIRQEDVSSQIVGKTEYLQPHLPRLIWDNVETVVVPLRPEIVLSVGGELVEPPRLDVVVIVVDRTAGRKACQGLHIGIFLEVMTIPVTEIKLVVFAKSMVQSSGGKVLPRVVIEESPVRFQLADEILVQRILASRETCRRADG